jgi:hypothetical protein
VTPRVSAAVRRASSSRRAKTTVQRRQR